MQIVPGTVSVNGTRFDDSFVTPGASQVTKVGTGAGPPGHFFCDGGPSRQREQLGQLVPGFVCAEEIHVVAKGAECASVADSRRESVRYLRLSASALPGRP